MSPFSVRLQRLAIVGAVGIAILAGAFHLIFDRSTAEGPPAAARQVASQPLGDLSDFDALPDQAASDRAFHLVARARRLAERGRFAEANGKLDEADKMVPGLSETAEARRKIAELATPDGQFALQVARARTAIGNDDFAEVDKALAEARRLKPDAPEVAELRQAMQEAQQKEAKRSSRVAELIAEMRASIARKDIAGADRAFNEASRIDVLDPALDQARTELAEAHAAPRDENPR